MVLYIIAKKFCIEKQGSQYAHLIKITGFFITTWAGMFGLALTIIKLINDKTKVV